MALYRVWDCLFFMYKCLSTESDVFVCLLGVVSLPPLLLLLVLWLFDCVFVCVRANIFFVLCQPFTSNTLKGLSKHTTKHTNTHRLTTNSRRTYNSRRPSTVGVHTNTYEQTPNTPEHAMTVHTCHHSARCCCECECECVCAHTPPLHPVFVLPLILVLPLWLCVSVRLHRPQQQQTLTHTLTHKRRKLLLEQQRLFTIAGYVGTTLWPILSACISLQAANTHTPTDIHITTRTSFAAASAHTQATDTQDDPYVIYTITHDYWNTHIQTHLVGTLAGTLFFATMCVMICLRVKSVLSPNMTFLQQSNAIIDYRHTLLLQQRQDSSVGATMPSMTVHTPVINNPTLMMGSARANTQTAHPNANDTLIEMTTGKLSPIKHTSSSSSALNIQSPHRSPLRTRTVGSMMTNNNGMSPSITQQLAIQAPLVRDEEETISDFDTMDLHTFTPDAHKRMFHDNDEDDDEGAVLDEDDVLGDYDRVLAHKK
jgi:hypothetical protein